MAVPVSWSPKDPDETVNYELPWASQLLGDDTILTSVWSDVTGVVLEADTIADDARSTFARLSGGVDGVNAFLTNTVTTATGETLELLVLLPIVSNTPGELTGYDKPRVSDLTARYPAFASVPYQTIAVHLRDAESGADESWAQADYAPAIMALAAHTMSLLGIGDEGEVQGYRRAGVSNLKDGSFSVSFNDKGVTDACSDTLASTQYGRIYRRLLRKNKAGPRLAGGGVRADGWGPLAQQNDGTILPWPGY